MTPRYVHLLVLLAVWLGAVAPAGAADDMDALRARFKQRYAQLLKLKEAGKVGETWEGYVAAVKPQFKDETAPLVNAENADRRKLYVLLAEDEGLTPEEVAKNNAVRNFQKARKGEYLRGPDGEWKRKP